MAALHRSRHSVDVEGCFGCKAVGLTIYGVSPDLEVGHGKSDRTTQKKWDKELDLYQTARKQGVQPATTKTRDIQKALDISDKAGKPFDAGTGTFRHVPTQATKVSI